MERDVPGPEQPLEQGWLQSPEAPTNELHTPGAPGQGQSGPLFPERLVQAVPASQAGKTTEASLGVPCVRGCGRSSSKSRVWVQTVL